MHDLFIILSDGLLGAIFYLSGLLVWPVCALVWRKQKRRTRALRWVFGCELTCLLVLAGFARFSHGLLEHGYYWFILMILANLIFTPLALGAAVYDYARSEKRQTPSVG